MKKIEVIFKSCLIFFGGMILLAFFCSIFNYFGLFGMNISHILCYIYIIIMGFVLGFKNGCNASKRGFVEGIKIGGIFVLLLLLLNVIFFQSTFTFGRFIYYFLILIFTIIGAMLGINRRSNSTN